jgi:hypothetical protein
MTIGVMLGLSVSVKKSTPSYFENHTPAIRPLWICRTGGATYKVAPLRQSQHRVCSAMPSSNSYTMVEMNLFFNGLPSNKVLD